MKMNDIIEFLESFFEAEGAARDASKQMDNADFNAKLARMNEFLLPSLQNAFGMLPRKQDEVFSGRVSAQKTARRHLFRIDKWSDNQYGELYGAYVSAVGGFGDKIYHHLLFVAALDGELKIVRRYFLDIVGKGKHRWQMNGGDESIELSKLSRPEEILRLLAPDEDTDGNSMELYLKD